MDLKNSLPKYGVIGAGSFGTAVANLLAENGNVLLYSRSKEVVEDMAKTRTHRTHTLHERVFPTNQLEQIVDECYLIFPMIPSDHFKDMLLKIAPLLKPYHIVIHGTKGLHVEKEITPDAEIQKEDVYTMSELLLKYTGVVRVGCIAGPNLAVELSENQPAATVVASQFDEVIEEGQKALKSSRFQVYGSNELIGVELAGVLKNYVAIASGMLSGLGFGENARALLITRGMAELIYIAKTFGASEKSFLGIAGIGDLIATCNSTNSRNYKVGFRLAKGEQLADIKFDMNEIAEGIKTIQIVKALEKYGYKAPLATTLHKIIFDDMPIKKGIDFLMRFPVKEDAEYV